MKDTLSTEQKLQVEWENQADRLTNLFAKPQSLSRAEYRKLIPPAPIQEIPGYKFLLVQPTSKTSKGKVVFPYDHLIRASGLHVIFNTPSPDTHRGERPYIAWAKLGDLVDEPPYNRSNPDEGSLPATLAEGIALFLHYPEDLRQAERVVFGGTLIYGRNYPTFEKGYIKSTKGQLGSGTFRYDPDAECLGQIPADYRPSIANSTDPYHPLWVIPQIPQAA